MANMQQVSHTNIRGRSIKLVPSCSGIAVSPVQPRSLLLLGLAFGLAAGSLAAVGSLLGGRLFSVPRQMFQFKKKHIAEPNMEDLKAKVPRYLSDVRSHAAFESYETNLPQGGCFLQRFLPSRKG